jgi:hypothetical protein
LYRVCPCVGFTIDTVGGLATTFSVILSIAVEPPSSFTHTVTFRVPGLEKTVSSVEPWPIVPSLSVLQTMSAQQPS